MLENLGQVLPFAAQQFGDKTALVIGSRSFSFHDLNHLSGRIASGLNGLGITAGDRVTLYAQNCWEWIVSYYAIARLGAVVNPINVMLTPDEVAYIVKDCGARAILVPSAKVKPLIDLKEHTSLQDIIVFGDDAPAGTRSFNALLEESAPEFDDVDSDPEKLSTIGYTSGTTGYPKGAMLTHRAVLFNSAMFANMHVRTQADITVTALPCAHVYGNIILNGAFLTGMTLVPLERFVEADVLQSIQTYHATMFEGVPTMFLYLLNYPELEHYDLSSLTRCTVGGQTLPAAKMQKVEERFGCPLLEVWGMTEIAGAGTTHPYYDKNRLGSIGRALPAIECRVADLANPSKTPEVGEVGELLVRGPIVMQGYFGNAEATHEAIEPDGWLHSGDVAYKDADGYFFIVDRKKEMILTSGYNVYPAELERVREKTGYVLSLIARQEKGVALPCKARSLFLQTESDGHILRDRGEVELLAVPGLFLAVNVCEKTNSADV